MKSQQKRQLYKDSVKRAILNASLHIIDTEGYHAVSIRKIADAIEYSAPTIYEYFKNKDALLLELHKEWIKQILDIVQKVHAFEKDPLQALEKISLAYVTYALENGVRYKAIMGSKTENEFAEINTIRTILKELIEKATKSTQDLDDKVDIFRSYLHAIISLALTKKLQGSYNRCMALAKEGFHNLIKAWNS